MNGCEIGDYTITPYRVNNTLQYAVSVKYGDFLAYCNHQESAIAVRDDAIRRARKLNGGK